MTSISNTKRQPALLIPSGLSTSRPPSSSSTTSTNSSTSSGIPTSNTISASSSAPSSSSSHTSSSLSTSTSTSSSTSRSSKLSPVKKLKLEVRLLPPNLDELEFTNQLSNYYSDMTNVESMYYVQGHYPTKPYENPTYSRAYLKFKKESQLDSFISALQSKSFIEPETQDSVVPVLEKSITNIIPPPTRDGVKKRTLEDNPIYKSFLRYLNGDLKEFDLLTEYQASKEKERAKTKAQKQEKKARKKAKEQKKNSADTATSKKAKGNESSVDPKGQSKKGAKEKSNTANVSRLAKVAEKNTNEEVKEGKKTVLTKESDDIQDNPKKAKRNTAKKKLLSRDDIPARGSQDPTQALPLGETAIESSSKKARKKKKDPKDSSGLSSQSEIKNSSGKLKIGKRVRSSGSNWDAPFESSENSRAASSDGREDIEFKEKFNRLLDSAENAAKGIVTPIDSNSTGTSDIEFKKKLKSLVDLGIEFKKKQRGMKKGADQDSFPQSDSSISEAKTSEVKEKLEELLDYDENSRSTQSKEGSSSLRDSEFKQKLKSLVDSGFEQIKQNRKRALKDARKTPPDRINQLNDSKRPTSVDSKASSDEEFKEKLKEMAQKNKLEKNQKKRAAAKEKRERAKQELQSKENIVAANDELQRTSSEKPKINEEKNLPSQVEDIAIVKEGVDASSMEVSATVDAASND